MNKLTSELIRDILFASAVDAIDELEVNIEMILKKISNVEPQNDDRSFGRTLNQVDIIDEHGQTPLMHASRVGNIRMVKLLVKYGANLNLQDVHGVTALIQASGHSNTDSNMESVKFLIESGANLNLQEKDGWTALMMSSRYADSKSNIFTVKMLIDAGADLNMQCKNGLTALMYASDFNVVKLLVDSGADVNIQDSQGISALMGFCIDYISGDLDEIIDILIKNGANVNLCAKKNQTNLLIYFTERTESNRGIKIIKKLIESGININAQDNFGITALMYASLYGNIELVKILLKSGADLSLKSQDEHSVFVYAGQNVKENKIEIRNILLKTLAERNDCTLLIS